jgi:hypothetical protein
LLQILDILQYLPNTVKYPEFATKKTKKNSALLKGTTNMQKLTV